MRQVEIEKALREATGRLRGTLNVELVERAITRESLVLVGASKATLVVRETPFGPSLVLTYSHGDADISVERRALSNEIASLVARAGEAEDVFRVTDSDLLGRLTLKALGASEAIVTPIATSGTVDHVLIESASSESPFVSDALVTMRAFAEQGPWRSSRPICLRS